MLLINKVFAKPGTPSRIICPLHSKAIKISDVQELGDVMIKQLSGLFENKRNKLN